MSYRRPIGVVGLITPFNFPLAIPTWKMFPALLCGNSVIIKPSEDVPHTVHLLVEILLEAGLPPEVIQLVHGRGETVGKALVEHPEVPVISFTGSTETGRVIGETCGRMHKRLSLEMGGKNAMIVMDDADLDLALEGVLWGAFGTTGQRCTATSRLLLHRKIHDRFLRPAGRRRGGAARWATAARTKTDVGPLIHEASRDKVERYVEIGQEEGAELVTGGQARPAARAARTAGSTGPRSSPGSRPRQPAGAGGDLRAGAERDPGRLVRRGGAGQQRRALRPVELASTPETWTWRSGRCRSSTTASPTSTRRPSAPRRICRSAASRQTGNGHREGGWEVYEFYSETKVCYVDYSGTLQRAQIDNYDV